MVSNLIGYILSAVFKDRLLIGYIILLGIAVSLSVFLGSAAITEKDQFSIVFAASSLRLATIVTLILFITIFIRRNFEASNVEYLLSTPLTRLGFLTAHFVAFSILASLLVVASSSIIFFMPTVGGQIEGKILWAGSLWIESVIIVFTACFFAFTLKNSVFAILASFLFYILSRLIGGILFIIQNGGGENIVTNLIEKLMLLISIFVPRLDLMGQSSWLIYSDNLSINFTFIMTQGIVFCALVFIASYIDLKRKQF